MTRHPLVILLLAVAVCVALAWGLPLGLDAVKRSLSPDEPPGPAESTGPAGQSKGPTEGPVVSPNTPDIPSN